MIIKYINLPVCASWNTSRKYMLPSIYIGFQPGCTTLSASFKSLANLSNVIACARVLISSDCDVYRGSRIYA